jgi:hypothetical protein
MVSAKVVLVSGILSATVPTAVVADSRTFKQDTKQNVNCDSAGAISPVSDSCNQRAVNNVSNGVPRTGVPRTGVPRTGGAAAPTIGTLIVNKVCVMSTGGGPCPGNPSFGVQVTGTNSQPS